LAMFSLSANVVERSLNVFVKLSEISVCLVSFGSVAGLLAAYCCEAKSDFTSILRFPFKRFLKSLKLAAQQFYEAAGHLARLIKHFKISFVATLGFACIRDLDYKIDV
jgi:hypothetical protein